MMYDDDLLVCFNAVFQDIELVRQFLKHPYIYG